MTGAVPWWHSLRGRIALALAAVTLVIALPVAVVIDHRASVDAYERLRSETLAELDTAVGLFQAAEEVAVSESADAGLVPEPLRKLDVGVRETSFDGFTMWAAEGVDIELVLAVSNDLGAWLAQQVRLRWILAASVLAAVAASFGTGWWAGARFARRAREATEVTALIAASEPGISVAQPGRDEVAALTRSVDLLAATLHGRIDQERAFSAYAAHELRSPLTALVSAAELLPDDEVGGIVRRQTVRLRSLVADLLEIARSEADQVAELVVADAAEAIRLALLTSTGAGVELVIEATAPVLVEQRRIERILANLVANATRHGRPPVRVTVTGPRITVDDHGPGFPDWLISEGPRRFRTDGVVGGHGLGLSLVQVQARLLGAELSFTNRPVSACDPGGAHIELVLPQPDPSDA